MTTMDKQICDLRHIRLHEIEEFCYFSSRRFCFLIIDGVYTPVDPEVIYHTFSQDVSVQGEKYSCQPKHGRTQSYYVVLMLQLLIPLLLLSIIAIIKLRRRRKDKSEATPPLQVVKVEPITLEHNVRKNSHKRQGSTASAYVANRLPSIDEEDEDDALYAGNQSCELPAFNAAKHWVPSSFLY